MNITPLKTLLETKRGKPLPVPPALARLYGTLRMPLPNGRPYVFSNFVTSLDGVVSLNIKGHESGGDISGFSATDRMVMGLLRATADAVVIGSGTFLADRNHVWTAEDIFPKFGKEYRRLSKAIGRLERPLNVIVTGSGNLDLRLPVFKSRKVRTVVFTTAAGEKRLRRQRASESVDIRAIRAGAGTIKARTILDEVSRIAPCKRVLVEGGPRLVGDFYAERLMDEQFLTLAPQIVGHEMEDRKISLIMGRSFAPRDPLWGTVIDARYGGGLLFLRYSFR